MREMLEPRESGYLQTGDTYLYYREYGDNAAPHTLLLLHGNGEDWRCFERQIGPFAAAGYRVVTLDSRGHGASKRGKLPMTPQQLAADALDALEGLGIAKAVPVGFSDGGNLALLMAAMRPDVVEALVAAGPNLVPAGAKLSAQLPCELGYPLCRLLGRWSPQAALRADVLGLMVDQPQLSFEALSAIAAPALILGGEHDMIRAGHLRHIAAALPCGRLSVLAGASHFVFGEPWAEETNRRVLGFLAQVLPREKTGDPGAETDPAPAAADAEEVEEGPLAEVFFENPLT